MVKVKLVSGYLERVKLVLKVSGQALVSLTRPWRQVCRLVSNVVGIELGRAERAR